MIRAGAPDFSEDRISAGSRLPGSHTNIMVGRGAASVIWLTEARTSLPTRRHRVARIAEGSLRRLPICFFAGARTISRRLCGVGRDEQVGKLPQPGVTATGRTNHDRAAYTGSYPGEP